MATSYSLITKKDIWVTYTPKKRLIVFKSVKGIRSESVLSVYENKILEMLISHPDSVKTREEILLHAWAGRRVGAGRFGQCIFRLRAILGDEHDHDILQTVPRKGYVFNAACLSVPAAKKHSPSVPSIENENGSLHPSTTGESPPEINTAELTVYPECEMHEQTKASYGSLRLSILFVLLCTTNLAAFIFTAYLYFSKA
jgi:DNA-binding winged helix-turn-helix (wHTH) protein